MREQFAAISGRYEAHMRRLIFAVSNPLKCALLRKDTGSRGPGGSSWLRVNAAAATRGAGNPTADCARSDITEAFAKNSTKG